MTTSKSTSLQSLPDLHNFLPYALPQVPQGNLSIYPHPPDPASLDIIYPLTPDQPSHLSTSRDSIALSQPIPVLLNPNPPPPIPRQPRSPYHKTIRRDNRTVTALSLPNIMVANHRSIFPKFNNLVDEILEHDMQLGLHSEVWEDKENTAHANKIEEAMELHGIHYISTPRPNRRGGGTAITLIADSPFTLTKIDNSTMAGDQTLEVCWGLLKPKTPTSHIKVLIICAFYLPPYSKKKSSLTEHISLNYFRLKSQYPDSAFVCGGDKNDLNIQLLLNIDPTFRPDCDKSHLQNIRA